MSWTSLTQSEREAAAILGYDLATWDGNIAPAGALKPWDELSESECAAARKLGYERSEWDDELTAALPPRAAACAPLKDQQPPAAASPAPLEAQSVASGSETTASPRPSPRSASSRIARPTSASKVRWPSLTSSGSRRWWARWWGVERSQPRIKDRKVALGPPGPSDPRMLRDAHLCL